MIWRVILRPDVHGDLDDAAAWYESQRAGLGKEFLRAVLAVLPELAENPFLNSRRHQRQHIRWRFPDRFPYRIIYRIEEAARTVTVIGVLHAARHDRRWRLRL